MPSRETLAGSVVFSGGDATSGNAAADRGRINRGDLLMKRCEWLLGLGTEMREVCGTLLDPVVLAQLDAALAHEFSSQASARIETGEATLASAVANGQSAASLATLAEHLTTMRSTATKARNKANEADGVVAALCGRDDGTGGGNANGSDDSFDVAAVESVSAPMLVDVIDRLEEVKNSAAAAQAQAQALFVAQQRLSQAQAGIPRDKLGKGIAQQVALARHESPHRGRQLCELGEVLVRELPHTMNVFAQGGISEYKASLVAKETVFLSLADRARVDEKICGDIDAVVLMGNRELSAAARKEAYALEPEAFVKRHEKAVSERYVSLRPAADGMTLLTALIPLKQGVRILAKLTRVADSAKASGDGRGKGQVMADALMHRLIHHAPCDEGAGMLGDYRGVPQDSLGDSASTSGTPAASAAAPEKSGTMSRWEGAGQEPWCTSVNEPDVAVELIMTDRSLFGSSSDPAILVGYDLIPAPLAREMVLGSDDGSARGNSTGHDGSAPDGAEPSSSESGNSESVNSESASSELGGDDKHGGFRARVWLKRLFTHPASNSLLAMDSRARLFPDGMKEFLRLRDQRCQTPYCDAPIREYDHVKAYAAGGATTLENGQGLCAACNQAKESLNWSFERNTGLEGSATTTETRTPTGRRYVSTAPPLPGPSQHPSRRANRRC